MTNPPICNYEGSDYQQAFWEKGGRAYEDQAEAIALKKLLPKNGKLMLMSNLLCNNLAAPL